MTREKRLCRQQRLTVIVAMMILTGCGIQRDRGTEQAEAMAAIAEEASVGERIGTFTDRTGSIEVGLFRCDWVEARSVNRASCRAPDTHILVGGGAQIEGADDTHMAFLTGSYPSIEDKKTWLVETADLVGWPFEHRVRAYALGLRLEGVDVDELRDLMEIETVWSGNEKKSSPYVCAKTDGKYSRLVVGGGALTEWSDGGQLLVRSSVARGQGGDGVIGWCARSTDNDPPELGRVQAFMITIPWNPPGYTHRDLIAYPRSAATNVGTLYQSLAKSLGTNIYGAMTSIGAASTNGEGEGRDRMLSSLIPASGRTGTTAGAYVSSIDGAWEAEGSLEPLLVEIAPME